MVDGNRPTELYALARSSTKPRRGDRIGRGRSSCERAKVVAGASFRITVSQQIRNDCDRRRAGGNDRRCTLEMTVIEGIKTSIPLHLRILSEPDFIAGRLSTSFMERYLKESKPAARGGLAEAV